MDCIPSSLSGRQTNNSNGIQNLSSVLNNPHSFKSSSDPSGWLGWWSVAPPDFTPIITKHPPPDISQSNFLPYLSSISDTYSRLEDIVSLSSFPFI
ncbi:hypothetical protein OIU84_027814 [Salix udensis]|uniref:Uncharacterized protein n=1 Tax=Salix udensis TaxID=889485 RepID=A0AAD6NPL1_9ROSI|nr:hypothetical protein OIU84_027814 [Salix udensis]